VDTQLWSEDELDEAPLALFVGECKRVDAEPLHHAERAWNATVGHGPHEHVCGLGVEELEIPEVVVRRLSLRYLVVRFRLSSMDNIRELHGVLDEEDRDVVADDIPVALLGVEFDGKASNITDRVGAAAATEDCGKADEDRSLACLVSQNRGRGEIIRALEDSEGSEGTGTSGVDNSLWNPLMIESMDLCHG
jgi:hypothetical protein